MKNKNKLFISSIYTSPPNSMGGNTKITLEFIKHFHKKYEITIFTTEPITFSQYPGIPSSVKIISVPFPYKKFNLLSHSQEVNYIYGFLKRYFNEYPISQNDFFYSSSDFAPDVIPLYLLKSIHRFKWIPSLYLFIPSPIENLMYKYNFPFMKYIIYYIYQKIMFALILDKGAYFLVTNDIDKLKFPEDRRGDIFAIYGGVNTEDIPHKIYPKKIIYDAVYCGRLHEQKGVKQLLEIWKDVCQQNEKAILALIGNGSTKFEYELKMYIRNNKLENNIRLLGYINGKDKFAIYKSSKIFLHSTVYDNNGMVAAEALCSGLPVIMFDLPSLKKVYNQGCLKVAQNNYKEYKDKIIMLLSNKEEYKKYTPTDSQMKKLRSNWSWNNRFINISKILK